MLDILLVILFCWLFFKAVGLAFKVAWGGMKIVASVLLAIAVPMLFGCLFFLGGIILLVPVAILAIALGLLRACL